eukprot:scaffold25856_cov112-Isochrysis_galbana.AAC.2
MAAQTVSVMQPAWGARRVRMRRTPAVCVRMKKAGMVAWTVGAHAPMLAPHPTERIVCTWPL